MLSWAQVKPLIREILGEPLVLLGFRNPGVTMWRYREKFIDVVCFYYVGYMSEFHIEFGGQPRGLGRPQPKPWDCMFRTRLPHAVDDIYPRYRGIEICVSVEEQRESLEAIAPLLTQGVERWFAHFSTVEAAIEALKNNQEVGLARVADAAVGSPHYEQLLKLLYSLQDLSPK